MAAGARSAAVGIGTGSVRLELDPLPADRSARRRPGSAIIDVGELDLVAPGPLIGVSHWPSSSSPRVTTAVPVARSIVQRCGKPRLDQLQPNRGIRTDTLDLEIRLQRQIADPVRLHPCTFLVPSWTSSSKLEESADMLVLYE